MEWPDNVKLEDIRTQCAEFCAVASDCGLSKLVVHEDLYVGGSNFRSRIDHYLDKRKLEEGSSIRAENLKQENVRVVSPGYNGNSQWERRKKISRYIPIVAGKLDFISAAIHQSEPSIIPVDSSSNDKKSFVDMLMEFFRVKPKIHTSDYWNKLNLNCDGNGKNLGAMSRELLIDIMLHKKAAIALNFPENEGKYPTFYDQKKSGAIDVTWNRVSPKNIDDWGTIPGSNEKYIRLYFKERVKSSVFGKENATKETWVYATKDKWVTYEYLEEDGNLIEEGKKFVKKLTETTHPFNEIPIIILEVPNGLWLMDRLRETILSLYNRSSSLAYSLNQMAFSLLVIAGNGKAINQSIDPETGALFLEDGKANFIAPEVEIFKALMSDVERLEKCVDNIIQAAALSAASRDTQGRQSGVAKFREFGSIATLLDAFGSVLRDGIERAIELTKRVRKEEDVSLMLDGLDKFDVQSLEIKTDLASKLFKLPYLTDTFKRYILSSLQLAHSQNAAPMIRSRIVKECSEIDFEKHMASNDGTDADSMDDSMEENGDMEESKDMRSGMVKND